MASSVPSPVLQLIESNFEKILLLDAAERKERLKEEAKKKAKIINDNKPDNSKSWFWVMVSPE